MADALSLRRVALIATLVLIAVAVAIVGRWRGAEVDPARLAWVATAHQLGPVGYRDPAGAISPDGRSIAYSEGRFLRVRPLGGGPSVELPPGDGQIRHIAWHPDSRTILTDGDTAQSVWVLHDHVARSRRPLFGGRVTIDGTRDGGTVAVAVRALRQPAWSADGTSIAALVNGREGTELWTIAADGGTATASRLKHAASFPAWTSRGAIACVSSIEGRQRVTIPCDGDAVVPVPDRDAYGPIAFAPDAASVYAGMPNGAGTLDLWALPVAGGRARLLTSFARDSYAPSVAADGRMLFKVQSYRTHVAMTPAGGGGPSTPLASFQSETPSWDPTGRWIGITYGTWRRVVDDAHYPDIAQEAGIIEVNAAQPAAAVARVVDASDSEDQSLCWSPNGKWIAYHSHKEQSDDIWLRPADGSAPGRRISALGRGAETGWPRWSSDGRWVLFDGADPQTRRSVLFVAGVDQDSGQITRDPRALPITGVDAEVSHGEWLPDSARVVAIAKEQPGAHVIFTVGRDGGEARVVHRLATEHDAPGLAVSPDGREIAFIAPAADGFFQIFGLQLGGGTPRQITTDPSHKTQPSWSPDGATIGFTVWSYDAQFWHISSTR